MEIKQANLIFKRDHVKRAQTKRIAVHHSASAPSTTILDIQAWHHARDFYGIGYHYVIYANGDIYQGRPEWAIGAHAIGGNNDSIGICLCGNFETGKPTPEQMTSLVLLIRDIWTRYPRVAVVRHSDIQATACPGRLFPWAEMIKRLEGKKVIEQWKIDAIKKLEAAGILMPNVHAAEEPADKGWVAAVIVNVLKKLEGSK